LAWTVNEGYFGDTELTGRRAVMVGYWETDGSHWPWTVGIFVDATASDAQRDALAGILTGRYGGDPRRQYATAITTVRFVEPADISIDHTSGKQSINVRGRVNVRARNRYRTDARVSCGIPGHDQDGYEVVMEGLEVHTDGIDFSYEGNCGFSASYDYRSDSDSPPRRWGRRSRSASD
jgi:hypothetical protein